MPDHEYQDKDSVSVDGMYVTDNLTHEVQMAIGRIPCKTNTELQNCIAKTILFEEGEQNYIEQNKIVVLADTDSTLGDEFENSGDRLVSEINNIDNSIFEFDRIDIDSLSSLYKTPDEFLETVSNGTMSLHYVGHGNPFVWSRSYYLTVNDFDSLSSTTFPFFLTAMACGQNFDVTDSMSIVERLLLMDGGGSVASITSSGYNYLGIGNNLFNKFYQNILQNQNLTIGEALVNAKNESSNSRYIKRFTILGDPALKLPLQVIADVDPLTEGLPNTFALEQNYPNPFNPTTVISYQISAVSEVQLKVFDMLGREVATLVNQEQSAGYYSINFDASSVNQRLSSGMYIYRIKAGKFISTKKMILIK